MVISRIAIIGGGPAGTAAAKYSIDASLGSHIALRTNIDTSRRSVTSM